MLVAQSNPELVPEPKDVAEISSLEIGFNGGAVFVCPAILQKLLKPFEALALLERAVQIAFRRQKNSVCGRDDGDCCGLMTAVVELSKDAPKPGASFAVARFGSFAHVFAERAVRSA